MSINNTPNLIIKDLHFIYPNTKKSLLRGVYCEFYPNEIVTVIGKLGSGKSTLLRHINGLEKIQRGKIILHNKELKNYGNTLFTRIGFLFENPDDQLFYPIVADDIAFGPRNQKLSKEEVYSRVISASEEVGIVHLLDRETSSLSFGEKKLVAMAGILATKPEIILMDSPSTGFDLWTKPNFIKLLEKLKKDHTLIIASNSEDMLRISDRILLLWNGKVRGTYKSFRTFKSAMSRREKATIPGKIELNK